MIEAQGLMWEALDALIAKDVMRQPAVLRSGSTDPGMLLPLVVVTRAENLILTSDWARNTRFLLCLVLFVAYLF